MHARRLLLPIVLLAAYAYVHCAPRGPSVRLGDDSVLPRPAHALTVADAPATLEELKQRIAAVLERDRIPGAAIALVGRGGPIWVGGIGLRTLEPPAPVEADTVFRVGSLSKSIIALAVMRLADHGKLDVDRPLRELLPDAGLENPWEAVAPVTLAHCLEHTAGLDDLRFNEIFTEDEGLTVRETLALNPGSRRIRWRPGTRHAYSNVGYTLAARAIEVASGEPFDTYVRREVLAPLGIRDADFRRTEVLAPRLATGYLREDLAAPFAPFAHRPSASLLFSASDLARVVHFWIRRGEGYPPIVSAAGLARIERNGTLPYPRLDSEYGFANYGDVRHPTLARGHDGGMPGFHSSYRYFPSLGVGYVMLLNAEYSFRGYFQIRSLLYAYLAKDHAAAPPPPAGAPARLHADFYELAAPRSTLFEFIDRARMGWHVSEAADRVRLVEHNGDVYDLVPTADGLYRHPEECGSSAVFATNPDGTPVLVMSVLYAEAGAGLPARLRYAALSVAVLLLKLAPMFAIAVLGFGALVRRRMLPPSLVLWPALAGLACAVLPRLLELAFLRAVIGAVHPLTIAICGVTIAFAIASVVSLANVVRWARRPDRPQVVFLAFPALCGVAFCTLTVWLAAHGCIGFRTWAW